MPNLGALTSVTGKGKKAIEGQAGVLDAEFNGVPTMIGDMNIGRYVDPKYFVHIYNLGPIEQRISKPWLPGGSILIPACPKAQPYIEATKFPDVIQEKVGIQGSNEFTFRGRDARFYVQDALNPDDPQGSWKTANRPSSATSTNMGTNLYRLGVFWSVQNPPEQEAVDATRKFMESYFNSLIQEANSLHITKKDNEIGSLHRHAADWFGVSTDWHTTHYATVPCEGCGALIPPQTIIHSCGCVRNWEEAVKKGMRTKAQYEEAHAQ